MEKSESLEEMYRRKFEWMPDNIRNEMGHFNVFRLEPFIGDKAKPVPYKRRDYYKIMLVFGRSTVNYADKVINVQQQALSFSNPQIPYKWEHLDQIRGGVFCIFNRHFFQHYGNIHQYPVFQPGGGHIFELSDEQAAQVAAVFEKMFVEIGSDYIHKYDVLRNLVFELLHFAMKMQASTKLDKQPLNAAQRISTLFLELLERQFPLDENHPAIHLRAPSEFAAQLNIHVNHLNRAVKETTQKTSSQVIAERVLQEAQLMLRQSNWNVSEIAFALGFSEVSHFNNFFKKHTQTSPLKFRKG